MTEDEFVKGWGNLTILNDHFDGQDQPEKDLEAAFQCISKGKQTITLDEFASFFQKAYDYGLGKAIKVALKQKKYLK